MKRQLTCILCPRGCALSAEISGETVSVTGNSCPKGSEYAKNECLHPVRTVTATLRISNRYDTMVSVKTETPVPKDQMFKVMEQLRRISIEAPVRVGDVLPQTVCGSWILITKAVL